MAMSNVICQCMNQNIDTLNGLEFTVIIKFCKLILEKPLYKLYITGPSECAKSMLRECIVALLKIPFRRIIISNNIYGFKDDYINLHIPFAYSCMIHCTSPLYLWSTLEIKLKSMLEEQGCYAFLVKKLNCIEPFGSSGKNPIYNKTDIFTSHINFPKEIWSIIIKLLIENECKYQCLYNLMFTCTNLYNEIKKAITEYVYKLHNSVTQKELSTCIHNGNVIEEIVCHLKALRKSTIMFAHENNVWGVEACIKTGYLFHRVNGDDVYQSLLDCCRAFTYHGNLTLLKRLYKIITRVFSKKFESHDHIVVVNEILCQACYCGKLEITLWIISTGIKITSEAIHAAIVGKQNLLLRNLLHRNHIHCFNLLYEAVKSCDVDSVKFVCEILDTKLLNSALDQTMINAIYFGEMDIINYLINIGAKNWNIYLRYAIECASLEIIKLLVGEGAEPSYEMIYEAGILGRFEIENFLIERSNFILR